MRKSNNSSGAWAEVHGTLGDVTKGEPGKSAYEIAVEHGFEGTEEEWLAYVQANADRAVSAERSAVDAKEAAQYASDEAQGFSESASTSSGVAHTEAEAAAESAARAGAAATSAVESRDGAAMSAVDAAGSATEAAASATEAASQALLATGRADEARQSQIDAHVSEVHCEEMWLAFKRSPDLAKQYAEEAALSAQNAADSETAAAASAQAAAQSATEAAGSATASANSATASAGSASESASSASDSADSASEAAASATAAAGSATAAAGSATQAEAAVTRAVSEAVTAAQTAVQSQINSKLDVDGKAVDSAHADDADTVNNHTVLSDVPANAVFTDTTYQQMTDQELEDGISTQGRVVAANTIATFILNVIADVINSAPAALDTLEELAAAINDDPDFHVTVMNEIGKKLDKAGGVVTGDLTVNGTLTADVTGNAATATKQSCVVSTNGKYADVVNVTDGTNRVGTIRITNGDGYTDMLLGVHNESNGAPSGLSLRNTNGTIEANLGGALTTAGNITIERSGPVEILKNTAVQTTVYPSSGNQDTRINAADKNGHNLASFLHRVEPTKSYATLRAFNFNRSDSENAWVDISVGYDNSGNTFTSAPTPATADNSTKIATTAFVKAQGYITSSGNSATATKLATARTINIQDSSATNTGTGASFDGSGNATIKLPATIKADVTGNCSGSSGSCTGNSATASKAAQLTTARTIDGVSFNGTGNIAHYGSCSTAAATVEKAVACTGFTLAAGARIEVKFTVTNTAANPTLNVNSTGAKAIYYRGAAISAGYLAANRTYTFVYNGTQYELVGDLNTDTNNATAQNISTTNATYPILLGYTANATANIGNKAALFSSKAKLNASTAAMTLNGKTVPVVSSFNSTTGVLALVSSGS